MQALTNCKRGGSICVDQNYFFKSRITKKMFDLTVRTAGRVPV